MTAMTGISKRLEKELIRLEGYTQYERPLWDAGTRVCGMDEAGRGPLAGPVSAGCVMLPPTPLIPFINDSKKLSPARREELYALITEAGVWSVAFVDNDVIDEINILNATKLAFKRAFCGMAEKPSHALIDAVTGLDIDAETTSIIKGDALSYLIGAASILAKVTRDRFMTEMDAVYPQYGFIQNKGYGTAAHIAALREYGPCPLHRRSFIGGILGRD